MAQGAARQASALVHEQVDALAGTQASSSDPWPWWDRPWEGDSADEAAAKAAAAAAATVRNAPLVDLNAIPLELTAICHEI